MDLIAHETLLNRRGIAIDQHEQAVGTLVSVLLNV